MFLFLHVFSIVFLYFFQYLITVHYLIPKRRTDQELM